MEAERAKVRLSSETTTSLDLQRIDPAAPDTLASVPLDRHTVRELSAPILQRTFLICDQVLSRAGVVARDVEAVFLAGGCTLSPDVREAVASYFGPKLRYELDPMHVVGIGASIAAIRPRYAELLLEG
jgi:molecular chaperone DnaK